MSDDEDRAARLRRRRQRSSASAPARADESDAGADDTEADDTEAGESNDPGDAAADLGSVKDEQVGTYMYLPEWQKRELERVYGLISTKYEYQYDEEFEKNRHFYPLLIEYGLDELDGLDAEAVRERLSALREPIDE